jgi:hypothetical protein
VCDFFLVLDALFLFFFSRKTLLFLSFFWFVISSTLLFMIIFSLVCNVKV